MHTTGRKVALSTHLKSLIFVWGTKETTQSWNFLTGSDQALEVENRGGIGREPGWSNMAGQLTQPVGQYGT